MWWSAFTRMVPARLRNLGPVSVASHRAPWKLYVATAWPSTCCIRFVCEAGRGSTRVCVDAVLFPEEALVRAAWANEFVTTIGGDDMDCRTYRYRRLAIISANRRSLVVMVGGG